MNRTARLLVLASLFLVCLGATFLQHQREQRRQAAPPNALYEVVWKQIRAIQAGDTQLAYRHVSSGFQEKFHPEAFAEYARTEYPGLTRAERVEFGAVRFEGAHATVPVFFFLPGGDVVRCVYRLVNERDAWKIDGARVLRRLPAGRRLGGMRA
jgi:Domain of unknown function (DUF4864)